MIPCERRNSVTEVSMLFTEGAGSDLRFVRYLKTKVTYVAGLSLGDNSSSGCGLTPQV